MKRRWVFAALWSFGGASDMWRLSSHRTMWLPGTAAPYWYWAPLAALCFLLAGQNLVEKEPAA